MKSWKASGQDAGERLVGFLRDKMGGGHSAKALKRAIENNLCRVNGAVERFASRRLSAGDLVQFDEMGLDAVPPKAFVVEKDKILYEDDALLFYNKPAGIASDEKGLGSLFKRYMLVHRLDKETTGVILIAKSEPIKRAMIELFKSMQVKKSYLALVDGVIKGHSGVIETHIGKISKEGEPIQWGSVGSSRGRRAVTSWEVEQQGRSAALVKCAPITGRTHQIRVHMKEMGHPILGDYQYAKAFRAPYLPKRCMLHALELEFAHPLTGRPLSVLAPLPPDFQEAMEKVLS